MYYNNISISLIFCCLVSNSFCAPTKGSTCSTPASGSSDQSSQHYNLVTQLQSNASKQWDSGATKIITAFTDTAGQIFNTAIEPVTGNMLIASNAKEVTDYFEEKVRRLIQVFNTSLQAHIIEVDAKFKELIYKILPEIEASSSKIIENASKQIKGGILEEILPGIEASLKKFIENASEQIKGGILEEILPGIEARSSKIIENVSKLIDNTCVKLETEIIDQSLQKGINYIQYLVFKTIFVIFICSMTYKYYSYHLQKRIIYLHSKT